MGKQDIFDGVYRICRWVLGSIFIYAGSTKLFEPREFALLIEAYGFVPDLWLMPLAIGLPALELLGGMGLIFDIQGSVGIMAGLLGVFVTVLWGMGFGWDWRWIAAALARKILNPKPFTDSGPPCSGIWS